MIKETDPEKMYRAMQAKLSGVVPDFELKLKSEIAAEINRLKAEKNAVILGHNYMEPALFNSVPDFAGDSLELARRAAETDKDIIVFCGVRFMAETAKILNPTKTVLLPAKKAGCSLAASITAEDVRELRSGFPDSRCYLCEYLRGRKSRVRPLLHLWLMLARSRIVKTDTDSSYPDEYLARNVANETGKGD